MDVKFQPAMAAIKSGDVQQLRDLVKQDPSLATSRSSCSHPTLLQCLVLDAAAQPNKIEMAQVLIDAGAALDEPLLACGSCDNAGVASLLLDHGAEMDGRGDWTPLEESLYWNSRRMVDLLLQRGATIQNLRTASGLGRTDVMAGFFNSDGTLKPEAGPINWPWGIRRAQQMAAKSSAWTNNRQNIIDNALVYACMHGHINAAEFLLGKGAQINSIPGGFDYAGTGLHYAALNGHKTMVDFLVNRGADISLKDSKVGGTAAGWADYGGHKDLADHLRQINPAT